MRTITKAALMGVALSVAAACAPEAEPDPIAVSELDQADYVTRVFSGESAVLQVLDSGDTDNSRLRHAYETAAATEGSGPRNPDAPVIGAEPVRLLVAVSFSGDSVRLGNDGFCDTVRFDQSIEVPEGRRPYIGGVALGDEETFVTVNWPSDGNEAGEFAQVCTAMDKEPDSVVLYAGMTAPVTLP